MKMSSPSDHAPELPAVDERIVAPESGYEIDGGRLVRVVPALEPHGNRHSKISALLEAHVADDFDVAIDMLTRTSEIDDFAPDVSVYPKARDRRTGRRQLEHLAFEIVATESLSHAGEKAAKLCDRGVRRVFAVDVDRARAFEWSTALGDWSLLDPFSSIEDVAFAVPLQIDVMLRTAKADDAVAKALLAKHNPIIVAAVAGGRAEGRAVGLAEGRAEGRAEGLAEGRAEAVRRVLARRGLVPLPTELHRIREQRDLAELERWLDRAVVCVSVVDLFDTE